MSHQTGIRANDELLRCFSSCKDGHVRLIKVIIKSGNEEQLCLADTRNVRGQLEGDYKAFASPLIEDHSPCFLLIRLDTIAHSGYDWLLISYTPDTAPVRQKMLYAATRATLKSDFGTGNIREEFHATTREETSWDGYLRWRHSKLSPGPMTEVEKELANVRINESHFQNHPPSTRISHTSNGVLFPIDQDAVDKLFHLRDGKINYVQLSVDTLNEAIKLERFDSVALPQLKFMVPKREPRYHFYVFKHQYEGDYYNSVVFIYSMPSQGCSVREKMLYSSCKNPFLESVFKYVGLNVDRKIEVDTADELSEQFLLDEIHPKIHLHQPHFARPQGPSRGPKRITRPQV